MKITVFMVGSSHYHDVGWRRQTSFSDLSYNVKRWIEIAQRIEAAKLDAIFVADHIGPLEYGTDEVFSRSPRGDRLHPIPLLAALAVSTRRVGLAATIMTSYTQPYDVAREFSSLDLISGGRAAWNIVTGATMQDALQYGGGFAAPEERYARGEEFVNVVTRLWDSVEEGAFPRNKVSGIYADPSKIHAIDFQGKYYNVKGPLSVERSPQGRPILVQAGQSSPGRALASRVADVIFTAQDSYESASAFYSDIRRRAAEFGRDPTAVKILPGVMPVIGESRAHADEKEAELRSLIDPLVGIRKLNLWLHGIDLSKYDLDQPFPELPPSATVSRGANYVNMARKENLTIRQVMVRASESNAHFRVKGTPIDIADQLEHWFKSGAADGFNLLCENLPDSLDDFIRLVVPELRRRGLFRHDYEGKTLRENLGVPLAPIPDQRCG
jgi:FMN-dependent oxidoreductase (nitrilotriacetate monooxygenase family)